MGVNFSLATESFYQFLESVQVGHHTAGRL